MLEPRETLPIFFYCSDHPGGTICQLFLLQFPEDKQVRTFSMTHLVMGNIASTNLSILAMRKTAELGNNPTKYPVTYDTITRRTYVDNVLIDTSNHHKLGKDIAEIELVSEKGVEISRQDVPEQFISVQLPNQKVVDEERALGVSWDVKND